jgi:NADPH:quinone reductase-like Zn-dependent oxidoreductase
MKAVRIHAYGHSDQILVEDVSQPAPAPDEVLVRIRDAGVNPVDWKIREGFMANVAPRTFPFTLGQDLCGEILALGSEVEDVEAGDEVYGFANGAYAEYAVVTPDMVASKPTTIDDAIAATLPTPGLTALQLVRAVQPARGQTVLIHGAAGAVGSIATQLVLASGARVIGTSAGEDAAYLTSLGVAQVIDYKVQRFEDRVRDADTVIDLVGGDTFARSLGVLREGGFIITTVASTDAAKSRPVRASRIVMKRDKADLEELARLVDRGALEPRPARVLPLAAAREAQELSQSGRSRDKIVLAPVRPNEARRRAPEARGAG